MRPKLMYKACTEKTSKIRLNFMANSFVCGRKNRDNEPRNFTSQGENFQNVSKLHRKQLHFLTHKL